MQRAVLFSSMGYSMGYMQRGILLSLSTFIAGDRDRGTSQVPQGACRRNGRYRDGDYNPGEKKGTEVDQHEED